MHPETTEIAKHMRAYALAVLGRSAYDVTFSEMTRPYAHVMAVTLAAHGAEIMVKARIAEQHPLLIFNQLPKATSTQGPLSIKELFAGGRTFAFADLPERLWATTGYRMANAPTFLDFGLLRNQIMHFAVPSLDHSQATLRFVFEVAEPMANDFWGESIIPYAEEYDDVIAADGYLQEQLRRHKIRQTKVMKQHFAELKAESRRQREEYAKMQHSMAGRRRPSQKDPTDA